MAERRVTPQEQAAEKKRIAQIELDARRAAQQRARDAETARRAEALETLREDALRQGARPLLGLSGNEVRPVALDPRGRVITGLGPDDLDDLRAIERHARLERNRERPAQALDTIASLVERILRRHGEGA